MEGHLRVCHDNIDGAILQATDTDGADPDLGRWSAESVAFTLDDLAELIPGHVLCLSGEFDDDGDEVLNVTASLREFEVRACELISGPERASSARHVRMIV